MAAVPATQQDNRYPFLFGTQEQRVPIAAIPVAVGLKAPTVRVPKNGYLLKMLYRLQVLVTVSGAGSAGRPNVHNFLTSLVLAYNGGFQYRQWDGESLYVANLMRYAGQGDLGYGGSGFTSYNPASATAQNIQFVLEDNIGLNIKSSADLYLLAAQARNADITLDVTFGGLNSMQANTETVSAITGTLFVDGLFLLDPDYNSFKMPDLTKVQQFVTDTSYTAVTLGDNTVSVVPVNGPKYLQLAFKCVFNGVADVGGFLSAVTRVQLKINNGVARIDTSIATIQQENAELLQRTSLTTGTNAGYNVPATTGNAFGSLPPGWYLLDFLTELDSNGQVARIGGDLMGGPALGRNVISTEKIANLWLIVTVAAGTTLTANNMIKLIKRVEMPAVA